MNSQIHIITIHYNSEMWVELQLKKIKKYFKNPKIWTIYNKMEMSEYKKDFYYCETGNVKIEKDNIDLNSIPKRSLNHWTKLNYLTNKIVNDSHSNDNDILIWMDCDAFPIAYVDDFIFNTLIKYKFFAINRKEVNNSVIPHPSFAGCKLKFWKEQNLSWEGIPFGTEGSETQDTGGKIYTHLNKNKIEWYKLNLSHTLTPHDYYFSIYDSMIYHHGAGTRKRKYMKGIKVKHTEMFRKINNENFDFLQKNTNSNYL